MALLKFHDELHNYRKKIADPQSHPSWNDSAWTHFVYNDQSQGRVMWGVHPVCTIQWMKPPRDVSTWCLHVSPLPSSQLHILIQLRFLSHYILLKNVLNITQLIEPSLPLGLGMLCWEHSVNVAVSWSSVPFQFTSLQAVSNKKSLQTSASTALFNFFKMFLVLGKCVYTFTMKWLLAYTEKTISYLYYGYTKKKQLWGLLKINIDYCCYCPKEIKNAKRMLVRMLKV